MGKQGIASIGSLLGFYIISLPCGAILAFNYEYGLSGLWIGNVVG